MPLLFNIALVTCTYNDAHLPKLLIVNSLIACMEIKQNLPETML